MTYIVFLFTATFMVFPCNADRLPPPTNLTYEWLSSNAVNLSWQRPRGLPEECEIGYIIHLPITKLNKEIRTKCTYYEHSCLPGVMDSDHWKYTVYTTNYTFCKGWTQSKNVTITVDNHTPRAELVRDFRCVSHPEEKNCSWIPANPLLNLSLFYGICDEEFPNNSLKPCEQPYSSGGRNGCYLKAKAGDVSISIVLESKIGKTILRPLLVILPPDLTIKKDGHYPSLTWTPPESWKDCHWKFEICFTKCDEPTQCQNFSWTQEQNMKPQMRLYDENCLYRFKSRVFSSKYCQKMESTWSEFITYGSNKPPDQTLTVAAVVIPIIVLVFFTLSCYCFRKHSDIICPNTPDPSTIFKEMMMNGNKEFKTTAETLYKPVPETIETCKIVLKTENSEVQENS